MSISINFTDCLVIILPTYRNKDQKPSISGHYWSPVTSGTCFIIQLNLFVKKSNSEPDTIFPCHCPPSPQEQGGKIDKMTTHKTQILNSDCLWSICNACNVLTYHHDLFSSWAKAGVSTEGGLAGQAPLEVGADFKDEVDQGNLFEADANLPSCPSEEGKKAQGGSFVLKHKLPELK